jgi:predicted flap endonuclease-1-like 5' DNA nuclease
MNQAAISDPTHSMRAALTFGTVTTVHLILVALFAIVVLAALVYGIRSRRRRLRAEQTLRDHAEQAGVPVNTVSPDEPSLPADRDTSQVAAAPSDQRPTPRLVADRDTSFQTPDHLPPEEEEEQASRPFADEPIAAAAPMEASPATEAVSAPTPAADLSLVPVAAPSASPADGPVTQLKGLGPKVAARLAELGITTVGQIAALSDDEAERLDADLGAFRGRMGRDRWIEQARFLAAGDRSGFEAVFGKL